MLDILSWHIFILYGVVYSFFKKVHLKACAYKHHVKIHTFPDFLCDFIILAYNVDKILAIYFSKLLILSCFITGPTHNEHSFDLVLYSSIVISVVVWTCLLMFIPNAVYISHVLFIFSPSPAPKFNETFPSLSNNLWAAGCGHHIVSLLLDLVCSFWKS